MSSTNYAEPVLFGEMAKAGELVPTDLAYLVLQLDGDVFYSSGQYADLWLVSREDAKAARAVQAIEEG